MLNAFTILSEFFIQYSKFPSPLLKWTSMMLSKRSMVTHDNLYNSTLENWLCFAILLTSNNKKTKTSHHTQNTIQTPQHALKTVANLPNLISSKILLLVSTCFILWTWSCSLLSLFHAELKFYVQCSLPKLRLAASHPPVQLLFPGTLLGQPMHSNFTRVCFLLSLLCLGAKIYISLSQITLFATRCLCCI